MTVERLLGYAQSRGVDISEDTQISMTEYQLELETRKPIEGVDQKGPSVLWECKKFIDMVPIKEIQIDADCILCWENNMLGSEEGKKEVTAFVLNGWAATYHTEYQRLTLIRA